MKFTMLAVLLLLCSGCTSLKPHEQLYLIDEDMQISTNTNNQFKQYVFSIREGAMPIQSKKSSGGCGCN